MFTPTDDDTRWSTTPVDDGTCASPKDTSRPASVWFTETEVQIVTLLQTGTDQEVRHYVETLASEKRTRCSTPVPVQEWPASSEGTLLHLPTGCTPIAADTG